jgi:SAM-dependent methyltransferase
MNNEAELVIDDMPLYWRIRDDVLNRHTHIPARLPYSFQFVPELNLITECRSEELLHWLGEIYKAESNVGFLQDGHSLSKGYGGDFLEFIQRQLRLRNIKTVIEIGCGGCYLLERLQKSGYEVTGIDPSPIAIAKGKEKGIRVIPDFYPSPKIQLKADLIFHADVLEHVSDPVSFLRKQADGLNADGSVIINVPDCTKSIARGDISIAFHQHLNSFDDRSLYNTVVAAGLHVVTIEKSKFGGSLYCLASIKKPEVPFLVEVPEENARSYLGRANKVKAIFSNLMASLAAQNKTVGFYMPLRAIPYLASTNHLEGIRFFDDIEHWHHRFFDGIDIPIENYEDLINNPVDHLFIISLTFADIVKYKVQMKCPEVKISTLSDILDLADKV